MKKTALFIIALFFFSASCNKTTQNEWERFYGFTQADVIGHYEANPDQSVYEELPTEGITVYDNAAIDISAVGSNAISLDIEIPGVLSKSFSGPLAMSDTNRSDITLTNVLSNVLKEDIWITVYKNKDAQVRFHGRVKRYHFRIDSSTHEQILVSSENWGFDVVKN